MATAFYEIASYHSIVRAKERIGCNEKNALKQINRALKCGKTAQQFTSKERSYLEEKCNEGTYAIAYNNYCYIVSTTGICVTVFALPAWFGKKKHYDGKEQIRNAKTYSRYNSRDDFGVWI
jgi:hypothetical protein